MKRNIKALLDIRPDKVTVLRNGATSVIHPQDIKLDEIIRAQNDAKNDFRNIEDKTEEELALIKKDADANCD